MTQDIHQAFADQVSYEGLLHVSCEIAAMPEPRELVLLNERNASLLLTLASLVDRRADGVEEDSALNQELARLDAKLNAVIELVNRLALPSVDLPPRIPVRFNALAAELPRRFLPAPDSRVMLRIHFDACRALPLELPGRVQEGSAGELGLVAYDGLAETVREAILKLVFRQHRRQVAEARHTVRPA
jgi:hypothetical protein